MRLIVSFLACCLLISASCFACGNEYYTTPDLPVVKGKLELLHLLDYPHDDTYPYWHHGFGDDIRQKRYEIAKKLKPVLEDFSGDLSWSDLEEALAKESNYKLLSDYAWHELRIGNKQKAVALLEALYQKYPAEYNIVANLGTAYEVTGKNEKALELIKNAVAINPASHHGSEWIHVHILEQKISQQPDYSRIIGMAEKNLNKEQTEELMKQIAYQLHERISFIAPPDPIVGQLIADFAHLASTVYSKQEAVPFFKYALTYDSSINKDSYQKKLRVAEKTTPPVTKNKNNSFPVMMLSGVLLFSLVGYFVYRGKKRLTQ